MKRVLFDINILLDVLLDRAPHAVMSAAVWNLVEAGSAEGFLSAHAVTTLHYLYRKESSATRAKGAILTLLRIFSVAQVDSAVIQEALRLPCPDFEDAVTAVAAKLSGCDYIVTRDPKGFRGSAVRCLTPEALLPLFQAA